MIESYAQLLALAEREASLMETGAWEDVAALAHERAVLVATLPVTPPPEAGRILDRLLGMSQVAAARLAAARAETARELGKLGRGRGAVRGYAVSGGQSAAPSIRLDGSA